MRKKILIICFLLCLSSILFSSGTSRDADDTNQDGKDDQWISIDSEGITIIENDKNYDGIVDYVLHIDEWGEKKLETMDFNHDGEMDDFYYYRNGVLVNREIDSNYDTIVDIWVYIHEGVYVKRYERDTDFDGTIDVTKSFGGDETEKDIE